MADKMFCETQHQLGNITDKDFEKYLQVKSIQSTSKKSFFLVISKFNEKNVNV